ncbi:MAG: winged helix-turn-helix domain-containing protein, partial [Actinomycetota bacterium]|nr:winged helix-turn-helix domain-containing protein [Actinomycetota bacterium]
MGTGAFTAASWLRQHAFTTFQSMEFRVLGPVELTDGGQVLTPTRSQERRLLALLLAHANRVVSADRMADALWPGQDRPA